MVPRPTLHFPTVRGLRVDKRPAVETDMVAMLAHRPLQENLAPAGSLLLGAEPREMIPAVGTQHLGHDVLRVSR
jgi:hypothetical protein